MNGAGDSFVKKLLQYMKAKGHLSLLHDVVRKLERERKQPRAVVSVSKKSDAKKFEQMIKDSLNTLGVDMRDASTMEDVKLVGGYQVRAGATSIDRSFRTALVSLYRKTTH
jgi:F0F1-type ATP synthase delta subunit